METLGSFGNFPIALKPENILGLENELSMAPNWEEEAAVNDIELRYICIDSIVSRCDVDNVFGPIVRAIKGACLKEAKDTGSI